MTNLSTPNEFQDLKKQEALKVKSLKHDFLPSKLTMSIIMGYGSALEVISTRALGKIAILKN